MDRGQLVRETLETAADYSGKAAEFIAAMAAKIQGGGRVEPSGWEDMIKGLEWLAEVCSALAGEPSLGPAAAAKLSGFVAELPPILQELSQAMEKRDVVSLGDFLEYELAEKIAELHETLFSCVWQESGGLTDTGAN
ncbi:MAG: hypothetical protein DDT21_00927 [Syntrophomonadaceae bacterium]|nr:hypothetical protein [Bacillota bacterium]